MNSLNCFHCAVDAAVGSFKLKKQWSMASSVVTEQTFFCFPTKINCLLYSNRLLKGITWKQCGSEAHERENKVFFSTFQLTFVPRGINEWIKITRKVKQMIRPERKSENETITEMNCQRKCKVIKHPCICLASWSAPFMRAIRSKIWTRARIAFSFLCLRSSRVTSRVLVHACKCTLSSNTESESICLLVQRRSSFIFVLNGI